MIKRRLLFLSSAVLFTFAILFLAGFLDESDGGGSEVRLNSQFQSIVVEGAGSEV